jgi:hypothetical protein
MFKRSNLTGPLNSPRKCWNTLQINNYLKNVSLMAGLSEQYNYMPFCNMAEITLNFAIEPGGSGTQSLPSRAGYWMILARRASVTYQGEQFRTPALITVSSYVVSEDSGTNVVLIEDQPIVNLFGTGEWQEYQYMDYPANVNNRIFTVNNMSSYPVEVSISFKTITIDPEAFDTEESESVA